jgi:hypothetical protein
VPSIFYFVFEYSFVQLRHSLRHLPAFSVINVISHACPSGLMDQIAASIVDVPLKELIDVIHR